MNESEQRFKAYWVDAPPGQENLTQAEQTFIYDHQDDEIFLPASQQDFLMATHDATSMVSHGGRPFLPISWLRKEYPGKPFDVAEKRIRESAGLPA